MNDVLFKLKKKGEGEGMRERNENLLEGFITEYTDLDMWWLLHNNRVET